jgi:hypothetical protein
MLRCTHLQSYILFFWFAWLVRVSATSPWIQYPPKGFATMTHYQIPLGFVAACGCAPLSTYYPTAALNQMAYGTLNPFQPRQIMFLTLDSNTGSSRAYGPACGTCFNLTLLNTFLSNPRFYPNVTKSVVVKVTDLCPLSRDGWCSATENKPNQSVRVFIS